MLTVLVHDELQRRLVLLQRQLQLLLLLLQLPDLSVLLGQPHHQRGPGPVLGHLIQLCDVVLVLAQADMVASEREREREGGGDGGRMKERERK